MRKQLRRTVSFSIGGLWGDEPDGGHDDIQVVRIADFDYTRLSVADSVPTRRKIDARLAAHRVLRAGDLLLEKSGGGDKQNVGRAVLWAGGEPTVSSNFINVLRPAPAHDSRFLTYLHRALYVAGHADACTKQTTGIQNLDLAAYLSTDVHVPLHREQQAIADFLDRNRQRIENLASASTKLDRVRSEAYERMLRDRIGLGDWPLVQIRHLARTGTGHTPSRGHPEYWLSDERVVPWFTLVDVWQLRDDELEVVQDTAEMLSEVGLANSAAVRHPSDTVLLSRTASVGFSAVIARAMAVSQDFMTWTCGPRLEPHFLLYALRAMRPELRRLMTGSTHKTIYMPDLHALEVPLPPIGVQREAVDEIKKALRPHWKLRRRTEELRARLAEYRDALISEAVTGQLDVTRVSESQMEERAHAAMEGEPLEAVR